MTIGDIVVIVDSKDWIHADEWLGIPALVAPPQSSEYKYSFQLRWHKPTYWSFDFIHLDLERYPKAFEVIGHVDV